MFSTEEIFWVVYLNFLIRGVLQAIKDNDIHDIVLSYLVHNCYRETLESFVACTGMPEPVDYVEDMEKRKSI